MISSGRATVSVVEAADPFPRIVDDGGYSVPPAHGWVRKDAMLKLKDKDGGVDAYTFYKTELGKYPDPTHPAPFWLHWFLGITLEKSNKNDSDLRRREHRLVLGFRLSEGPEKLRKSREALDRAYQELDESQKMLEGDHRDFRSAVAVLQAARNYVEQGNRLIDDVQHMNHAPWRPIGRN